MELDSLIFEIWVYVHVKRVISFDTTFVDESFVHKYLSSTVRSLYIAVEREQIRLHTEQWAATTQNVCSADQHESLGVSYSSTWNSPAEVLRDRHSGSSRIL